MRRILVIVVLTMFFIVSSMFTFADNVTQSKGCGCDKNSSTVRDKERNREQRQVKLFYKTQDGKLYWWNRSYNSRLRNYDKNGDQDGLNRYLYEIASSYSFENKSDEDGFVKWALKEKPWNEE
jgi:uncharacterized protein YxeA